MRIHYEPEMTFVKVGEVISRAVLLIFMKKVTILKLSVLLPTTWIIQVTTRYHLQGEGQIRGWAGHRLPKALLGDAQRVIALLRFEHIALEGVIKTVLKYRRARIDHQKRLPDGGANIHVQIGPASLGVVLVSLDVLSGVRADNERKYIRRLVRSGLNKGLTSGTQYRLLRTTR